MDAALLWLLIAASRGAARGEPARRDRETDGAETPARASMVPLRRRLHARSAWLRALEEVALVDRRMKPSPIRKLW
jgi:hypothetical protein